MTTNDPTETVIERVARAIRWQDMQETGHALREDAQARLNATWSDKIPHAQAAIEAMREPATTTRYSVLLGYPPDATVMVTIGGPGDIRSFAIERAKELALNYPDELYCVVNDRGSIIWTRDWEAGESEDPPADQS